MISKKLTLLVLILLRIPISAQDTVKVQSLGEFLRVGAISGKSRVYFMQSDNMKPLTDYHGLGLGAGIGYTTPGFKGFSAGMSGYFIINAWSSDFSEPDSITQNPNRYELGLFDLTDPTNKTNLYRLEDLWLKYEHKGSRLKIGQFVPDYLFINPQDGRMSPTMVRGLDLRNSSKAGKFMFAYLQGISPRSTIRWYKAAESIGIYPVGRATNGKPSDYAGNITSRGIVLAEWSSPRIKNLALTLGSMTVTDLLQTWYSDVSFSQKNWKLAALGIVQHKINKALNTSYIDPDHQSTVLSFRAERKWNYWVANLNFTRIAANDRFLMPREWGREPFYTFLPRERNEGAADVHAVSVNIHRKVNDQLSVHLGSGYYHLPDPANAAMNKYSMPSYNQLNLDLDYSWNEWLKGATVKLLFVRKGAVTDSLENQKFVFNKVNMNLLNLIFNYTF